MTTKTVAAETQRTGTTQTIVRPDIKMRMYNVGFGDCFLLRLPTDKGERRMLVDCGFHSQGKGKYTDKEIVAQIKADLAGDPLDVVVATHRHQDHISGFGEQEAWDEVGVEEVWLPFTADPDAPREEPSLAAWNSLSEAAAGFLDDEGKLNAAARMALDARDEEEQTAVEFMLWNARSNAPGLENLLRRMHRADGRPALRRFLPGPGDEYPTKFTTPALPGVTIHVLGPSRDPAYRKSKKAPESWGLDEAGRPSMSVGSPFQGEWRVPPDRLPSYLPFSEASLKLIRLFNDDLAHAAKALDGFLNGESLVLLIEFGRARLLLPGDAEVGTWMAILENPSALALAASATFLKVGHHGSHNATPLILIDEHLSAKTPAVISTQEGPGNYRNGIPFPKLLEKMAARQMPLARTDKTVAGRDGPFKSDPDGRWVDCRIVC